MKIFICILVLILSGCGSSGETLPDGGSPGGDGGGGNQDGGPEPDLGNDPMLIDDNEQVCAATKQSQLSPITRPLVNNANVEYDGNSTMAVWSVSPGSTVLPKSVWAQFKDSTLMAQGDFAFHNDGSLGKLFVFKSKFYVFHAGARTLYAFTGTTWAPVTNFTNIASIAVGSAKILGVVSSSNITSVVLFDGTTATAAQQISSFGYGPIASDGGVGFGAVSIESLGFNRATLRYLSYNGTTWSAESMIATVDYPGGTTTRSLQLAYTGGLAALAGFGYVADPALVWILSGTTWTPYTMTQDGDGPLLANAGAFAVVSRAAGNNYVSVYKAGTWTTTLVSNSSLSAGSWTTYGNGFAHFMNDYFVAPYVRFHDGTSWGAATDLGPRGIGTGGMRIAIGGSTIAVSFDASITTYEGGVWSALMPLTTTLGQSGTIGIAVEGADLAAVFPEPGTMRSRVRKAGSWSTPLTLPYSTTTGAVLEARLARAGNGRALALWSQVDAGPLLTYAAEYDGCNWGAPVMLTGAQSYVMEVAASHTRFVIGVYNGGQKLARWTGGATPVLQALGTGIDVKLSSDGLNFVAVWPDSGNIFYATSRDGDTFTAPQQLETGPGWTVSELVGGPAGVLLIARQTISGMPTNNRARVFRGDAWSAPQDFAAAATGSSSCHGAVGKQNVLIACYNSTSSTAYLLQNGVWSAAPFNTDVASISSNFWLSSDGNDYRLDIGSSITGSVLFHEGAWSSRVMNPNVGLSFSSGVITTAGREGVFKLMAPNATTPRNIFTVNASGSMPYDATSLSTLGVTYVNYPEGFISRAGRTDAVWFSSTATQPNIPALFAGINL